VWAIEDHLGTSNFSDKGIFNAEHLIKFFSYCKNVEEVYCSTYLGDKHYIVQSGEITMLTFKAQNSVLLPIAKILHIHMPQLYEHVASLLQPFFPHLEVLDLTMAKEISQQNLADLATVKSLHTVIIQELGHNHESLPFKVIEHPPPGRKSVNQMVRQNIWWS
jgi:hypothetical protein